MIRSQKHVAIPPGYYINELLQSQNIPAEVLVQKLKISREDFNELLAGNKKVTKEIAKILSEEIGLTSENWEKLEKKYQETIELINKENKADNLEALKDFPYKKMSDLGWIKKTTNRLERLKNLLDYFNTDVLPKAPEDLNLTVICRQLGNTEKSKKASLVLIQKAKELAIEKQVVPIKKEIDLDLIKEIRYATTQNSTYFNTKLIPKLNEYGIILITLPHIENSYLQGFTFQLGENIVITLTDRGKDLDRLWFSLLHELGHIILGHLDKELSNESENQADIFAQNSLIPENKYKEFVDVANFEINNIKQFADNIGIHISIVIGRLQKDNYIKSNQFNNFKPKIINI